MKYRLLLAALCFAHPAFAQQVTPGSSSAGLAALYTPGSFYTPGTFPGFSAAPLATGGNKIVCTAGQIGQPTAITLALLVGRVATADAAGSVQFAVYSNGSWNRPAAPLAGTASIATTPIGNLSSAAVVQLVPGLYWWCANTNSATAVLHSLASTILGPYQAVAGGSSITNVINTTVAQGISTAQAFGTWPTFTSSTTWADVINPTVPVIGFSVGSVP